MIPLNHQAIVDLFRHRPALAPELILNALGEDIPAYRNAHLEPFDLSQVSPDDPGPDLLILLTSGRRWAMLLSNGVPKKPMSSVSRLSWRAAFTAKASMRRTVSYSRKTLLYKCPERSTGLLALLPGWCVRRKEANKALWSQTVDQARR